MDSNSLVVVPAFNEENNIGAVLEDLGKYFSNVLVISDSCTDGTTHICKNYKFSRVINHLFNIGQGGAIQTGVDFFLNHTSFDYLITFDGDGQHRAIDAYNMISFIKTSGSDLVVGTRFKTLTAKNEIPLSKRFALAISTKIENLITGLKLSDAHNGLRVFTRRACSHIDLWNLKMAHSTEILMIASASKLKVNEFPVVIRYTEYGQHPLNGVNILLDLIVSRLLIRKQ